MTHPLIVAETKAIEEVGVAAVAESATNSMNPRAIAVAMIVVGKPRGEWGLARDRPVEEMVEAGVSRTRRGAR